MNVGRGILATVLAVAFGALLTTNAMAASVAITAPSTDGRTLGVAALTISGTSGNATGDGTPHVTVTRGGITVYETDVTKGLWSFDASILGQGPFALTITQTDDAGGLATATRTFIVDTVAPSVSWTTPNKSRFNIRQPTLTGTAGTAAGDSTFVQVALFDGIGTSGTPIDSASPAVQSDGSFTYTPLALSTDATYTARVCQSDRVDAGAQNTACDTISFSTDQTAPILSIDPPAPATAGQFATSTPTLTGSRGTLDDTLLGVDDDLPTVTLVIMQNGQQVGPALTDSSTGSTWAITTGTLPDGNYTAVASQQDSAVNFGYSNIVSFTVDTVPPSPQLDQPPAFISDRVGVTISGSSPPAANGGDDLFVTAAITKLESGVTTSHFAVVDQATGAFSIILPLRGDGHYTATVYQSDVAHPFTPDTPPSDTVSFIVDSTPPTVTCDTPAPSFSVGGTGVVTATVTDALSGPAASTVSAPADLSTLGTRTVTVTGSDRAGNMTSVACPYTVGARITILSPQPGTAIGSGGIVPVSFALTDGSGSRLTRAQAQALANSCAVRVWLDSRTPVCATYDASTRTFRATLYIPKQATQGTHTVTVGVYSGSTLVSSRSVDITYGAATKPR